MKLWSSSACQMYELVPKSLFHLHDGANLVKPAISKIYMVNTYVGVSYRVAKNMKSKIKMGL